MRYCPLCGSRLVRGTTITGGSIPCDYCPECIDQ